MPLLSRIPIRITLPLLLVSPVVIVALTLSVISYQNGRHAAQELVAQELAQIHERIDAHVSELLSAAARITEVNASMIAGAKLSPQDLDAWRDTLIAQMHAYDMLSTVAWADRDGRAVWVCRYVGDDEHTYYAVKEEPGLGPMPEYRVTHDGVVSEEPASVFDFDPRVRPWYITPVEAGEPAWCEPFVWVGGADASRPTLGLSFGRPFYDGDGEILGVVDADLSLLDISKYLSRLRIGQRGAAFIVDVNGLIIASSVDVLTADEDSNRIRASESEHPWLAAAARVVDPDGDMLRQTITVGGERLLLVAAPFEHETGQRWSILTLVPEADFLGDVTAARNRSLAISAGIGVVTIIGGIVIAVFAVRPVLKLTAHVRSIGEGNLDETIHLSESPELARLSEEINEMTVGLRDRMRMRHSLAVAMDVQQALLPSGSPTIQGLDLAGQSTYCDETGGDYYDFLEIEDVDEHTAVVALGDVMGHGVAAAMLMATARGILRSRCRERGSLGELLEHVNSLLVPDTGGTRFMTMLLAMVDAQSHTLRWASAGHDPPFLFDPKTGSCAELDGAGLPLGIIGDETYEEYEYDKLEAGQVIFLATDGVWEMQNAETEQFGKDRVRDVLQENAGRTASEIGDAIRAALTEHRGEETSDDDVTFIVIKVMA